MPKEDFLAKTGEKEQTIEEHTREVLDALDSFLTLYGDFFDRKEQALFRLACAYHDLGKMNQKFQDKLKNKQWVNPGEIPHGFLSTLFINTKELICEGFSREEIRCLITAVMYHHTRYFDLKKVKLDEYIHDYLQTQANDYFGVSSYPLFKNNPNYCLFDFENTFNYSHKEWLNYVLIKGILNKADYVASNPRELLIERPIPKGEQGLKSSILNQIGPSLYPAQTFLKDHSEDNIILIAPAGSGKTEGALLWAGENKTFFALPLKVSSNSIYHRVKKCYQFNEVALLHSDALSQQFEEVKGDFDLLFHRYEEMQGLAYPVTICTVDQLFKFVFKSVGTEMIASTFRYSKVIIDEIQSYHPKIIAFLCYGMKLIHELGGKFLLMTATLPPMVSAYLEKEGIPLLKETFIELNAGIRHILTIKGEPSENLSFDYPLILKQAEEKKVLILCNTVKKAQDVYRHLIKIERDESISIRLLHSRFIKKHREELEEEILAFAKNGTSGGNGIWISTQIVEASLDIDFDVLHTEMCPVDSLFQRMGRCYRSRTLKGREPNIYLYPTNNGRGTIYDKMVYLRSFEALLPYEGVPLSEEDKMKLISIVYDEEALKGSSYYQTFERALKELESITPGSFSKQTSDYLFREIRNVVVLPDAVFKGVGQDFIEEQLMIVQNKDFSLQERYEAKSKLLELTTSLTLYNGLPQGVDQGILDDGRLNIHRTNLKYSYNPIKKTGLGLVLGEFEEDDQFI